MTFTKQLRDIMREDLCHQAYRLDVRISKHDNFRVWRDRVRLAAVVKLVAEWHSGDAE